MQKNTENTIRAKTINDIPKVFYYKSLEAQDKDYFVDIYKDELYKIKQRLQDNPDPKKTFFIAGQTGNGKTTALNFLPILHPNIAKEYEILHLSGKEEFPYDNINIIDIILFIGFRIDRKFNKDIFIKKLEKLKNKELEKYKEDYFNDYDKAIFNLIAPQNNFDKEYKREEHIRDSVRKLFMSRRSIIDIVNETIREYSAKSLGSKRLLLMIDDLEKKRGDYIDEIFGNQANLTLLNDIECVKFVMIPIYFMTKSAFIEDAFIFSIRLTSNPLTEIKGVKIDFDDKSKKNEKLLNDIIKNRLEDKSIIEDKAITKAIEYSGGNLRQLMIFIQRAKSYLHEDSKSISDKEIESVKEELNNTFSLSLNGRVDLLYNIQVNHTLDDTENKVFKDSINDNMIFAYFNGLPWYDTNPVVKDTVSVYHKAQNKSK